MPLIIILIQVRMSDDLSDPSPRREAPVVINGPSWELIRPGHHYTIPHPAKATIQPQGS